MEKALRINSRYASELVKPLTKALRDSFDVLEPLACGSNMSDRTWKHGYVRPSKDSKVRQALTEHAKGVVQGAWRLQQYQQRLRWRAEGRHDIEFPSSHTFYHIAFEIISCVVFVHASFALISFL